MNTRRGSAGAALAAFLVFIAWLPATAAARNLSTERELRARGGQLLDAATVEKIFAGRTVRVRIISGDHTGRLREHRFDSNGGFRTKNLWDDREDGQNWYISDHSQLCRRYQRWFNKSIVCRKVYALSDTYYWVGNDGLVECVVLEIYPNP